MRLSLHLPSSFSLSSLLLSLSEWGSLRLPSSSSLSSLLSLSEWGFHFTYPPLPRSPLSSSRCLNEAHCAYPPLPRSPLSVFTAFINYLNKTSHLSGSQARSGLVFSTARITDTHRIIPALDSLMNWLCSVHCAKPCPNPLLRCRHFFWEGINQWLWSEPSLILRYLLQAFYWCKHSSYD